MIDRIHLYTKIHKAQRAWLMRALVAAGRLDPDDRDATQLAAADTRRLVHHLHEHAEHEERFIHPMLREAAPEIASRLDAEHIALDAALAELTVAAESLDGVRIYHALNGFVVLYFPHLALEEQEAMPAIWRRFNDGEVMDRVLRPFVTARTREDMADDLRLQIGAVSPREECQLFSALLK
jgi:hemerythrin-like domain-containing protein